MGTMNIYIYTYIHKSKKYVSIPPFLAKNREDITETCVLTEARNLV